VSGRRVKTLRVEIDEVDFNGGGGFSELATEEIHHIHHFGFVAFQLCNDELLLANQFARLV
jgi:hypothetical protein